MGETLRFPTATEEVQALLKRIGVDGVRYQEFFITSFDGDVLGLYDYLTEYENIDELNHLACLLSEMSQSDLEKFEAIIDGGEHTSDVKDLITAGIIRPTSPYRTSTGKSAGKENRRSLRKPAAPSLPYGTRQTAISMPICRRA